MKNRKFFVKGFYLAALFIVLTGLTRTIKAQFPSDSAKIYLLTVSPGNEIYSYFGHSAIQIYDPKHGFNVAYGYGTFDFDTPHFYTKFVMGRLLYSLSVEQYGDFLYTYQSTGQAVYHQQLNLTPAEKWQLIRNLETNYKPENRYYRYDFLYDNCSTRIRDIIEKSVNGKIRFDSSYRDHPMRFRELLHKALQNHPWVALGINTLLGTGADKMASIRNEMCLPARLMKAFSNSRVITKGKIRTLSGPPEEILPASFIPEKPDPLYAPSLIFSVFFLIVLILTYWGYRRKKYSPWFDLILFSITGVLGLLFLTIWIGSLHRVMGNNLNILWANPLNFAVIISLFLRSKPKAGIHAIRKVLFILYILFIPVSVIMNHHFYPVPVLMALIMLIRLQRIAAHLNLNRSAGLN